jgi:glucose/arabinose dehydrogenase
VHVSSTIATNLEAPWGIALLSDGTALVAERDSGRVLHISADGARTLVGTVPGAVHTTGGENGLLGLAVRPHDDSMVWAYESTSGGNRVIRMTYSGGKLGAPHTILDGIPTAVHHNGGRLAFGPDGDLYVGTGDAEVRPRAQDKGSLGGKILRIAPDGSVPSDNPFSGSPVWSYGHRNVQGLAFDSAGRLWATEFGQDTWDELNLIVKGGNYGWPVVEGDQAHAGFREPKVEWHTDEASPSGLAIVDDVAYVAALKGQRLWQVALHGTDVGTPKAWFVGTYGRLRTVVAVGNGLWLTTSNTDDRGNPGRSDDRILRLTLG